MSDRDRSFVRTVYEFFIKSQTLGSVFTLVLLGSIASWYLTWFSPDSALVSRVIATAATAASFALAGLYASAYLSREEQEKIRGELEGIRGDLSRFRHQSAIWIPSADELFQELCRARERASREILLMKLRADPPVEVEDGRVKLDATGRPEEVPATSRRRRSNWVRRAGSARAGGI